MFPHCFVMRVHVFLNGGTFKVITWCLTTNLYKGLIVFQIHRCPICAINGILQEFMSNRVSIIRIIGRFKSTTSVRSCTEGTTHRYFRGRIKGVFFRQEGSGRICNVVCVSRFILVLSMERQMSVREGLFLRLLKLITRCSSSRQLFPFQVFLDRRFTNFSWVFNPFPLVNSLCQTRRGRLLILQRRAFNPYLFLIL